MEVLKERMEVDKRAFSGRLIGDRAAAERRAEWESTGIAWAVTDGSWLPESAYAVAEGVYVGRAIKGGDGLHVGTVRVGENSSG